MIRDRDAKFTTAFNALFTAIDVRTIRTPCGRHGNAIAEPAADETFEAFIHRLNDEWVRAAARVSPQLLIDMLAVTCPQVLNLWRTTDLDSTGAPVSWAGPEPAPVWLDCARDSPSTGCTSSRSARRPAGRAPPSRRS